MTDLKELLNAFKKDRNYRISVIFLFSIIILFIFSFYLITQKPVTLIPLILFFICALLIIVLFIFYFTYAFKSHTITLWLIKEKEENPKKKIIRFTIIVAITCLIFYLLGYGSSRIIMNSLLFIIFYALFAFQYYGKKGGGKK